MPMIRAADRALLRAHQSVVDLLQRQPQWLAMQCALLHGAASAANVALQGKWVALAINLFGTWCLLDIVRDPEFRLKHVLRAAGVACMTLDLMVALAGYPRPVFPLSMLSMVSFVCAAYFASCNPPRPPKPRGRLAPGGA